MEEFIFKKKFWIFLLPEKSLFIFISFSAFIEKNYLLSFVFCLLHIVSKSIPFLISLKNV